MAKQRSLRSLLTTKARDALFSYFGTFNLPPINTNIPSAKIVKWKKDPVVTLCYNKLFNQKGSLGVLTQILEKVFSDKYPLSLHIAFVTATLSVLLDLTSNTIQTNENTMKDKINFYMNVLDDDKMDLFKK
ncbi:hypothetical protein C1646_777190 [Rhizophagus diaphanus]|nr:hypothetical protein C1646_777190 [Rhizophagus diaphanus] [Rhizophagus sp. MUCL 43196]